MQNEDIIHRESGKLLNVPIQILKQQVDNEVTIKTCIKQLKILISIF